MNRIRKPEGGKQGKQEAHSLRVRTEKKKEKEEKTDAFLRTHPFLFARGKESALVFQTFRTFRLSGSGRFAAWRVEYAV